MIITFPDIHQAVVVFAKNVIVITKKYYLSLISSASNYTGEGEVKETTVQTLSTCHKPTRTVVICTNSY